jgi:hypothetical protein
VENNTISYYVWDPSVNPVRETPAGSNPTNVEAGKKQKGDKNTIGKTVDGSQPFSNGVKRLLKAASADDEHAKLLKHYKAALAVTDYMIKNPTKNSSSQ